MGDIESNWEGLILETPSATTIVAGDVYALTGKKASNSDFIN